MSQPVRKPRTESGSPRGARFAAQIPALHPLAFETEASTAFPLRGNPPRDPAFRANGDGPSALDVVPDSSFRISGGEPERQTSLFSRKPGLLASSLLHCAGAALAAGIFVLTPAPFSSPAEQIIEFEIASAGDPSQAAPEPILQDVALPEPIEIEHDIPAPEPEAEPAFQEPELPLPVDLSAPEALRPAEKPKPLQDAKKPQPKPSKPGSPRIVQPKPVKSKPVVTASPKTPALAPRQVNPRPPAQRADALTTAALAGFGATGSSDKSAASASALASFRSKIAAHLARYKRYPDEARNAGIGGRATLVFTLAANGSVSGITLAGGSGSALLDAETLAMARRAAPFPAIPTETGKTSMTFSVPIRYDVR